MQVINLVGFLFLKVVILDVRVPCTPVARLNNHRACVNGIAWAPHSSCHICTAGKCDPFLSSGIGESESLSLHFQNPLLPKAYVDLCLPFAKEYLQFRSPLLIDFPKIFMEMDTYWSLLRGSSKPSAQTVHLLWLSSISLMLLISLQSTV